MDWSTKRKLMYTTVFVLIFAFFVGYFGYLIFSKEPTCFDGKMNGLEQGVDCGGGCNLMCLSTVSEVKVLWTKLSKIDSGLYDLAFMVNNPNKDSSPLNLPYLISVYGQSGEVIFENQGTFSFEPGKSTPVVVPSVYLEKMPSQMSVRFGTSSFYKAYGEIGDRVTVERISLNRQIDKDEIIVNVKDRTLRLIESFPLIVVVYDNEGEIITTGYSKVFDLKGEEERDVSFVWPKPIEGDIGNIRAFPVFSALFVR